MAHYIVAQIDITDRARYRQYEAGFVEVFQAFDGVALVSDESPAILEGDWSCTRTVVLRFPTKEQALEWYESDAYQELAVHRYASSSANVAIVAGLTSN
jgi:uncharacterized protein (DUF1330 family)